MKRVRGSTAGLLAVLALAAWLYGWAQDPARFGFYHDDGVYAVMAKSLAEGRGYRILSLPGEPAQTKYPPFYPLLLSLVWRAGPEFPANLPPLLALSAVLVLAALLLVYGFLVCELGSGRGLALLAVALSAVNVRVLMMSGSLYSEALYTLVSVAALWACSRYAGADHRTGLGILAGLGLGLSFLTRSIGLSLVLAAAAYLGWARAWKKLSLVLAVAALLVLPWLFWRWYAGVDAANPLVASYTSYAVNFLDTIDSPGLLLNVVRKNLFHLLVLFAPVVTLSVDYAQTGRPLVLGLLVATFALMTLGFLRALVTQRRLLEWYVLFYVGTLLVTPYTSYDRFLLPLLPFLWLYLLDQALRLMRVPARRAAGVAPGGWRWAPAAAAVALGGVVLYWHFSTVSHLIARENPAYREVQRRRSPVFHWLRANTGHDDVLLCYDFDPLYYLYSGRKAVAALPIAAAYQRFFDPGRGPWPVATDLMRAVGWSAASYLVLNRSYGPEFYPLQEAARQAPETFVPVFRSDDSEVWVYRIRREHIKIHGRRRLGGTP